MDLPMDDLAHARPRRRASDRLGRRVSDAPTEPSPNGKPRRRQVDGWLDRWMATVQDLDRLKDSSPMLDATIEEQVGRRIRIGDRWLTDWASCNYLGFDLDPEIIAAIPEYVAKWGTHPSWSRLLGNPRLYPEIEEQLAELLGAEDTLVLPTITHIHMSVIPVLVGDGTLFLDGRAHKTIYDGAMVAAGHGANVVRFRHEDPAHLEELLRATSPAAPRLIAMDGVNSMTGNAPDLAEFSRIAQEYDCLLYVDDAHGFGVIGERSPDEPCDYGVKGNSVLRHQGVSYDHALLVAGFSKSYSSLLAFLALPTKLKDALKVLAPPYLYSGPSPVASLATTLAGLEVNRTRGDAIRGDLARKTDRLLDALHELGIHTPNQSGYPIIEVPLAHHEEIDEMGRYLFEHGQYATMAAYPLVPKNEVGFRIQVTASNTDEQIDELIEVLASLHDHFQLERVAGAVAT
jgi:8-amino-7-oxononanoate synthase